MSDFISTEANPRDGLTGASPAGRLSLSIVMPTHNRASVLEAVVRKTHECAAGFEVEWVIVDDGSTDNTAAVLAKLQQEIPRLRYVSVENRGPGQARNLGASMARHEVILFMGDDIMPANEDFLRPHAELHASFRSKGVAVLGKALWPSTRQLSINAVMRHIQGHGGEQFGYADLMAYRFYDWRFFYTCNISLRRDVVADWSREGFSDKFPAASFEDIEFAYRLSKQPGGFEILYCPSSAGYHLHHYQVGAFIRRQALAGAMAHIFLTMHPELGSMVFVADIQEAMESPIGDGRDDIAPDYLAAIEGLKSWARVLEHEQRLGTEAWHDDLLFIVFEVAYLQGYVTHAARAGTNFAKAYARILHRAKMRMGRILDSEIRHDPAFQARVMPKS
jgi:glycosyltransferase involved in cell wall biosynthesis